MRYSRDAVIEATGISGDTASAAIDANQLFAMSAQIIATGNLDGTIHLDGSNDAPTNTPGGPPSAPTNWSSITTKALTVAGVAMLTRTEICYRYIRLRFVRASGTGNLTVNLMSHGF